MLVPVYSANFTAFPESSGQIISDLGFVVVDGVTTLTAVSYGGDFVTYFDISGGDPAFVSQIELSHATGPVGFGAHLEVFSLDGSDYLAFSGFSGTATPYYQVSSGGALSVSLNFGDLASQSHISGISFDAGGGEDVVLATDYLSGSLRSYTANSGTLELASIGPLPANSPLDLREVSTIDSHGQRYAIVINQNDATVLAYRIEASGNLLLTDQVGAIDQLSLSTPTRIETTIIDERSFAIIADAGSNSLSVLEISETGGLIARDYVFDDLGTRFFGVSELKVVQDGDATFVIAAGADDGFSLFQLSPSGRLFHHASFEDTLETALQNPSALEAKIEGQSLSLFIASEAEAGITHFTVDLSEIGEISAASDEGGTTSGTAKNDVLEGKCDCATDQGH